MAKKHVEDYYLKMVSDYTEMKKTLNEFCGAKRRFELKDDLGNNILVYP